MGNFTISVSDGDYESMGRLAALCAFLEVQPDAALDATLGKVSVTFDEASIPWSKVNYP